MTDAIDLYLGRFGHVRERYARQLPHGRGYVRVDRPLTRAVARAHLAGEVTLGLYLLDAGDRCAFGVLDHDGYRTWTDAHGRQRRTPEDGLVLLQALREELAGAGIEAALECSRRGAHLWVFAAEPVPAREMRALLGWAAQGQQLEVYPKQEQRGSGVGSNIRAPLGVHRASGERYPFVDERGQPVARTMGGQIGYLAGVRPVDVAREVERLVGRRGDAVPEAREEVGEGRPDAPAVGRLARAESASAPATIATHLLSRAQPWQRSPIKEWVDAVRCDDVVRAYIPLDVRGVGHCPWPEHHADGDRHASFQVLTRANRWRCWATNETGNAFDFVCRMENLDPKEALSYCRSRWPVPELERGASGRA